LLIEELRSQLLKLQEQLENKLVSNSGFTAEQVDDEIIKAVKSETVNIKAQHEIEKNNLQNKIESLEKELDHKNELIQQLKTQQPAIDNNLSVLLSETNRKIEAMASTINFNREETITNSDRPKMETIFVDPIEKEMNVERHFEVEEISMNEKTQLDDKVNKLKGLLGKLPNKKS
jgi:hypothetical protein